MVNRLKSLAAASGALLFLFAAGAAVGQNTGQAASHNVCLLARDIDHSNSPDDNALFFHMRNGDVWRNTLKGPCPGLKIYGYAEQLRNDEVCANQQVIHLLRIGETCQLGDFTLETKGGTSDKLR